jgi:ribosomal protein L40E
MRGSMSKICYRCDAKNDMYATICKNCGYDLYEQVNIINKAKKKSKAPLIYLIFGFILPLLAVSIFFIGLYGYLYGYENYNSEVFLDKYLELIRTDNHKEIMKYNDINTDRFNTENEFGLYMSKEYGEKHDSTVIMKESSLSTENEEYYKVQFNGNTIKQFKLEKTGEKKLRYFSEWKVEKPEINVFVESVKIFAPMGVDVYVNDVLIGEEMLSSEEEVFPHYKGIKDENHKHPKLVSYTVDNLMAVSNVYAKRKDGELCDISLEKDVYRVTSGIPSNDLDELEQLAGEFGKQYAAFIAMDAKFVDLKVNIYQNTEFYDTLREFYNGWYPDHDNFGFEDLKVENMLWYDENHASVQVKFNHYVMHPKYKRRDYPVAYEIFFVKIDGKWLVAELKYI